MIHGCLEREGLGTPPSVVLSLAARSGQPQPSPFPRSRVRSALPAPSQVRGSESTGAAQLGAPTGPARPGGFSIQESGKGPVGGAWSREDAGSSGGCPCPWEARLPLLVWASVSCSAERGQRPGKQEVPSLRLCPHPQRSPPLTDPQASTKGPSVPAGTPRSLGSGALSWPEERWLPVGRLAEGPGDCQGQQPPRGAA